MKKHKGRFVEPANTRKVVKPQQANEIVSRPELGEEERAGTKGEEIDFALLQRPPLTKRTVRFLVAIEPENFDRLLPSWLDIVNVTGGFSERTFRESWFFKVEAEGNVPRPKAVLTQIARLERNGVKPLVLEVAPTHPGQELSSLTISQIRSDEYPTRFRDFEEEIRLLLSSFLKHFELSGVNSLSVSYRNELTQSRYADVWLNKDTIRLGGLLRVFRYMPNPKEAQFRDPFVIDFTRGYGAGEDITLRFRVNPEYSNKPLAWVSTISFSCKKDTLKRAGTDEILDEIRSGHDLISGEFRGQFTTEALKLFLQ